MKVVINKCYGGFGLSDKGVREYARRKGLTVYPEVKFGLTTYWTVPPEKRPHTLDGEAFYAASMEQRKESNEAYSRSVLYDRDISRSDPDLVLTVEALGSEADGQHAELKIVEIPDGIEWEIDEYDGREHIAQTHQTWS